MSVEARHYFVSGRVQGVCFRAETAAQAEALELSGWVRNRRDGRVEVLAAGWPESLAALEAWLRQGPPAARVEELTREPSATPPEQPGFELRPTA